MFILQSSQFIITVANISEIENVGSIILIKRSSVQFQGCGESYAASIIPSLLLSKHGESYLLNTNVDILQ